MHTNSLSTAIFPDNWNLFLHRTTDWGRSARPQKLNYLATFRNKHTPPRHLAHPSSPMKYVLRGPSFHLQTTEYFSHQWKRINTNEVLLCKAAEL